MAGRRILIVEDEVLVAMDLQMILEEKGCDVIGPAQTVVRALDLLSEHEPDAATLDLNLNGETSAPIAEALRKRSVPFVLTTGYGDRRTDPAFRDAPMVKKPYDVGELLKSLSTILE